MSYPEDNDVKIAYCTQCAYYPDTPMPRDRPCPRCEVDPALPMRGHIELMKRIDRLENEVSILKAERKLPSVKGSLRKLK